MLALAIGANWYWHAGFLNDRKSSLKKTRRKSMCVDVSANKFPLNADIRYKRSVQHFGTCRGQLPLLMATLQAVTKLQFHWLKGSNGHWSCILIGYLIHVFYRCVMSLLYLADNTRINKRQKEKWNIKAANNDNNVFKSGLSVPFCQ